MLDQKIERIEKALGQIVDTAPIALAYVDATDGRVLKYNKKAENLVLATTHLSGMPQTVYGDMDKLSYVAERMRRAEEFDFFVIYDHEQNRFVPLTHIAGAQASRVLVVHNFKAVDADGEFLADGMVIRRLVDSQNELMYSDLESARSHILTKAYGMTELIFHPQELTMDVIGGRDTYNLRDEPVEEVAKIIHPDDVDLFIDTFADAAVQHPESIKFKVRVFSVRLKCYRYFRLMFYPQIDTLGNVLVYGGFCIDITEEELALKRKMAKAQAIIESSDDDKDEQKIINALANISHDLRNPIGIMMGISDMMALTDDAEKRAEYNATMQKNAQRLLKMVSEIINLNRLELGNLEVKNEEFDLNKMLATIVQHCRLQFVSKGIEIKFDKPAGVLKMYSDENRLHEIIDNYISNALKYTEKGGVTIKYEDLGSDVKIHVIDTGKGISEEGCKKVFDRFEQLNTKIKGSGLGLHICRGLAKALGGGVGVESTIDQGSDFWVQIPKILPEVK